MAIDMIPKTDSDINMTIQFLQVGSKNMLFTNEFENWIYGSHVDSYGTNFFSFININVYLDYVKITFNVFKSYEFQVPIIKHIIKYLCKLTKESKHISDDVQQITKVFEMTRNSKYLASTDPKRFKGLQTDGDDNQKKFQYAQTCQYGDQPRLVTMFQYENMSPSEKERVSFLTNLTTGDPLILMCPENRKELNFMVDVNGPIFVDPKTGKDVTICIVCCRKCQPQNPERQKKNEICKKHGYFPISDIAKSQNLNHILKLTFVKYTFRLLHIPDIYKNMINTKNIYFFGPVYTKNIEMKLIYAVCVSLDLELEDFCAECTLYFDNNMQEFEMFLELSCSDMNTNPKSFFDKSMFVSNIKMSTRNFSYYEYSMSVLVKFVFKYEVLIFGDNRKYSKDMFISNTNAKFIILMFIEDTYFPIVKMMNPTYNGQKSSLNFLHSRYSDVIKGIENVIVLSDKQMLDEVSTLFKTIEKVATINYVYSKPKNTGYAINVTYENETFFFPIPQSVKYPTDKFNDKPCGFPSLKTLTDFCEDIKLDIVKYKICDSYVYGVKLSNGVIAYIKEDDIYYEDITSKNLTIKSLFDERILFMEDDEYMDEIDLEVNQACNIESGKQLTYPLFVLLSLKLLKDHIPDFEKCSKRKILADILSKPDFRDLLLKTDEIDYESKKQIYILLSYDQNPLNYLLLFDLSKFKTVPIKVYEQILIKDMKKYVQISESDLDFEQNLVYEPFLFHKKIVLDSHMVKKYPSIFLTELTSPFSGDFYFNNLKCIIEQSETLLKNSKMQNVEHADFSA